MAQIRGPGIAFPLDSPQNTGRGGAIQLQSGGIYLFPMGDYLLASGNQSVLQWFDPVNLQWRGVAPPGAVTNFFCDGGNFRLINLSGVVVGGQITNAGSGGTNGIGPSQTGSTISFGAPAAGGVTATATGYLIVGGTVPAPTVTQGGSGFLVPPLIFCDPPPQGGIQATFISTISSAGVLTGVTQVNPGAGYTSIPQFYIVPQPQFSMQAAQYPGGSGVPGGAGGPGAFPPPGLINPANVWPGTVFQGNIVTGTAGALLTGNALTGSGTLTGVVMTYYGAGYTGTTLPAATLAGTSLGAAAVTAIMSYCLTGTSVTGSSGTGYTVGLPAITTLGLLVNSANNTTFFPRPGRGVVTNATGPVFTIEDPGFGIQSAGTAVGIGGGTATAKGNVPAASLGGINDVSIIQSSVNS